MKFKLKSDLSFWIYSAESTWKVETYKRLQINEENVRILSRISGLEKHEYTKNMENLEMP